MASPTPPVRRGTAERALAWLWTGPLGHLYSTVADLAAYAGRSVLERRQRLGRDGPAP